MQRPVVLRKRRERVRSLANWKLFSYQFNRDHARADLIWNHRTREEFREAIETELRLLNQDRQLAANDTPIAWNHAEFTVRFLIAFIASSICIHVAEQSEDELSWGI